MPATIVQTNDTPFAKVAIDPVTLDIIENALRNARVEMDATLVRTAMSPGIREQGDAGMPIVAAQPDSPAAQAYRAIARALLVQLDGRPKLRSGIMASLLGG